MSIYKHTRIVAWAVAILCLLFPRTNAFPSGQASAPNEHFVARPLATAPYTLGTFAHQFIDGQLACVEASTQQAETLKERDRATPVAALNADDVSSLRHSGFKILLRGTEQLRARPEAIEPLKRAAAQWMSVTQAEGSIVIDIDFGSTSFGKPFDQAVVAAVDAQLLSGNCLYPGMRGALISANSARTALFNSLNTTTVKTDAGETGGMSASSANLRTLNVIDPTADPEAEWADFGAPPSIAINAAYRFDFDPGDGIDADGIDLETVAAHDIGHVLGFVSAASRASASADLEPSTLDLFRVRTIDAQAKFPWSDITRTLIIGGDQSFYDGSSILPLSTGGPNGAGGDGHESSHWKDQGNGSYIGVMAPAFGRGSHLSVTGNDVVALDAIGYQTRDILDPTTVIPLKSGSPQTDGMAAPPPGLGFLSHTQFSIRVRAGATSLKIDLDGNQDVDLFVRYGQPVFLQGHNPSTDYQSTTDSNFESITITPSSTPPLREGKYYIAVANFGPGEALYSVTATVQGGRDDDRPILFNVDARLEGNTLDLDCAALDRDRDFGSCEITLMEEGGRVLGPPSTLTLGSQSSIQIAPHLTISGLGDYLSSRLAGIVVIDANGNRSAEAVIDFGRGDVGGPSLTNASFNGSKLTLNVRGLTGTRQIEVNGVIVAPPRKIKGSDTKLKIKGAAEDFGLKTGPNRIRIRTAGGWSNIFVLNRD